MAFPGELIELRRELEAVRLEKEERQLEAARAEEKWKNELQRALDSEESLRQELTKAQHDYANLASSTSESIQSEWFRVQQGWQ